MVSMVSAAKDVSLKAFAALIIIIIVKELFGIDLYYISTAIFNQVLVILFYLVLLLLTTAILGLASRVEVEQEFSSKRDGSSKMKNQLHLYYLRLEGSLLSRTISSVHS